MIKKKLNFTMEKNVLISIRLNHKNNNINIKYKHLNLKYNRQFGEKLLVLMETMEL